MEKNVFDITIRNFYKSLGKSIGERKKALKLKREDILYTPERVSKIVNGRFNKHYPYLIAKYEYEELLCLFLGNDEKSFLELKNTAIHEPEKFIKEAGRNYDKMLWGHIKWENLFKDTIEDLSKVDISTDLGRLFEATLIDYVPYAVIKYNELHPKDGKIYIFPEKREETRTEAIQRVYYKCGNKLFKQTFLENFTGKTLDKFYKKYVEFVEDYLKQKEPNPYSLGLQAYNLCKNISGYSAKWQSLEETQYNDSEEKTDLEKLLEEYLINEREQVKKLKRYQQRFDSLKVIIE